MVNGLSKLAISEIIYRDDGKLNARIGYTEAIS
jgi:hypothetical protein